MGIIQPYPGSIREATKVSRMAISDTVETDQTEIACDGDGGALGHPRVYVNLGAWGENWCPYCSRHFITREKAAQKAAKAASG